MDTVAAGNRATGAAISYFLHEGMKVSLPLFAERYDLLVDDGNSIGRIQVKHGRLSKDRSYLLFSAASHSGTRKASEQHYRGQIEAFAVYVSETAKLYVVPVDRVCTTEARLRLHPSKNNQGKKIIWANEFEVRSPFSLL